MYAPEPRMAVESGENAHGERGADRTNGYVLRGEKVVDEFRKARGRDGAL